MLCSVDFLYVLDRSRNNQAIDCWTVDTRLYATAAAIIREAEHKRDCKKMHTHSNWGT